MDSKTLVDGIGKRGGRISASLAISAALENLLAKPAESAHRCPSIGPLSGRDRFELQSTHALEAMLVEAGRVRVDLLAPASRTQDANELQRNLDRRVDIDALTDATVNGISECGLLGGGFEGEFCVLQLPMDG